MSGALDGITALDLSQTMPGQLVGMTLADNGAQVIKIDPPSRGADRPYPGELVWDRGKKSLTLDLTKRPAQQALHRLVQRADVLIESYAPGVAARLGAGYETLSRLNPRLVYTTITGYGSTGPLANRPGYDALVQARLGIQAEQPLHSAQPAISRSGPIMIGVPVPAIGAFFMAAYATLAALIVREATGQGQHVETSLAQGLIANMTMRYWRTEKGGAAGPNAMVNGKLVPWLPTIFESKDGVWFYTMGTRRFRKEYSDWLGLPMDLQAIPVNVPEEEQYRVYNHMAGRFKERTWAELDKKFAELDCIVLPVQHASAAFEDPQIRHNGYIVEVDDPEFGRVRQGGVPYTMRKTPPKVRGGRARPGQHTDEVLLGAGLSRDEIEALRAAKAV